MKKSEAIQKLRALVFRIPDLEKQEKFSEDFQKWQSDARILLKHMFPKDKEYVSEFDEISYSLSAFVIGVTPEGEFDEAFRSGLRSARAMLQSRIDEVDQFWTEEPPAKTRKAPRASEPPKKPDIVFVIHGRQLLAEFHDFLRALGLKPLEWSKARSLTGKPNPYTWEIVDKALTEAGAIVALMTPDDEARLSPTLWSERESALEKEYLYQPRQNVLFEAGVALGRNPDRTVLIRVGSHRPMSDLSGHHILQLDDSAQSRKAVADALTNAGCPVDTSGSDWFQSGHFAIADYTMRGDVSRATREHIATLLFLKTKLKGYSDLSDAAGVVVEIHEFFKLHPQLFTRKRRGSRLS